MKEITLDSQVWMSHGDTITRLPAGFEVIASTASVRVAAYKVQGEQRYGIQYICGCRQDWTPDIFVETTVASLKEQLADDKVVMGLSGGVDSSVAATLIHRAIGENLHCIFVDNGLLRKNEFAEVLESYKGMGLNVKGVDAKEQFYQALHGIADPEGKRKVIGRVFIEVFDAEAHKIPGVKWLGQGTIYPDVIECTLHIPEEILERHPFPGPGLGIRILGDITPEKVAILQEVDHLFISALKEEGFYQEVWQAGAVLLPVQAVGVMGDERTYEQVVALRAVTSVDGMTADFAHLPADFLARVANSKPPATIEWE